MDSIYIYVCLNPEKEKAKIIEQLDNDEVQERNGHFEHLLRMTQQTGMHKLNGNYSGMYQAFSSQIYRFRQPEEDPVQFSDDTEGKLLRKDYEADKIRKHFIFDIDANIRSQLDF